MKLEKIKLAGFKSFVDPTTIPINGNLTAIVGPNGCGKSNIIDAVRWVMGESSAKHLRGGNMADVIFNGSSGRKPVSTATVELIFNNSEGKLGGEYAQYETISIKRQVSRDGQSLFMLNGARCRRKDITDIFLGTGLGSRSYAIIEQGTISRMVEAKPEDLRIHIEEAAGISKYKERRQETETRMRHTRENLERLNDVRDEVEKQLKHLQKQAEKAEKYTALKKQERQTQLELLAIRWHSYHQTAQQQENRLHEIANRHNRLFMEQRELDLLIGQQRAAYKQQQQQTHQCQGNYYTLAADVSRLEQTIKHHQQNQQETELELERSRQQASEWAEELSIDLENLEETRYSLAGTELESTSAEHAYQQQLVEQQNLQQQQQAWQQQWDEYRTASSAAKGHSEILRVQHAQLGQSNQQLQTRIDKLAAEQHNLTDHDLPEQLASLEETLQQSTEQREQLHDELQQIQQRQADQRQQLKQLQQHLHSHHAELANINGKITSLEVLQQHALGKDDTQLGAWLSDAGIETLPRLAESLEVESGWETAVETVLGGYLDAVCVGQLDGLIAQVENLADASLAILVTDRLTPTQGPECAMPACLLDKVKSPWPLAALLAEIYCAENLTEAHELSHKLSPHQSAITPDGSWFGPAWLKIKRTQDGKSGLLQREKELRALKQRQQELLAQCDGLEAAQHATEAGLKETETRRESLQRHYHQLNGELSTLNAQLSAQQAHWQQQQRRLAQINHELEELRQERADNAETIAEYEILLEAAQIGLETHERQRQQLENANRELQQQLEQNTQSVTSARQRLYDLKAKTEQLRMAEQAAIKQTERLKLQQQQTEQRIAELEEKQRLSSEPIDEERHALAEKLLAKNELEAQLKHFRLLQEETETEINRVAEQQLRTQRALEKEKSALDQLRFELQESQVRQQTVTEQLRELQADAEQILQNLTEGAEERSWKTKLDSLIGEIERLGTINLSAIEEYQAQSERLKFLDEQQADLLEALQTLDHAINKIDHESRLRFKETFDKINSGLQEKFPKLFGGGQAYLELTENDLLESGVNIIARPPGKRNSSIHLLSGGEKALTAVALVFSIFELNPAPFCLLDEVDAPLDDANVGRFSKMVEEMSNSVQFLYISHNKVTMEIAQQLAGVTMKEPGVSRMVAVDIEEAVTLADN